MKIVLGGGVSGLALAWHLQKKDEVVVIEKENRAGGWIRTVHEEGFLFEQGPRSCRRRGGEATLQLINELGLEKEVIEADPSAKKRYLLVDGKLHCLPTGVFSFFSSPLMKGIIPALFNDLKTSRGEGDESIYTFFSRRMSPEIAERLIDPMTLGIYAGDIKNLSIRSCFPSIYEWEKKYGSLLIGGMVPKKKRGKGGIFSLRNGMESITKALAKRVPVLVSNGVKEISFEKDYVKVILEDGSFLEGEHIYSTLPAKALSRLMEWKNPFKAASLAVVNLGYRASVLQKKGFGYLIPTRENEKILGVVFDSSAFPQQNKNPDETRLTVMVRHDPNNDSFDYLTLALDALARHLGIEQAPDAHVVKMVTEGIPQYTVGHQDLVSHMEKKLPDRLTVLGNSFYGVAVNDCLSHCFSCA